MPLRLIQIMAKSICDLITQLLIYGFYCCLNIFFKLMIVLFCQYRSAGKIEMTLLLLVFFRHIPFCTDAGLKGQRINTLSVCSTDMMIIGMGSTYSHQDIIITDVGSIFLHFCVKGLNLLQKDILIFFRKDCKNSTGIINRRHPCLFFQGIGHFRK